jgi:ubiquinone/menaquinone biosynthesis C-methylase UbiE
MPATVRKPYKGMAMEGFVARWYARNTGRSLAEFEALAKRIAAELRPGVLVLEVAPGPGYLAVAIAKLGDFRVTGIDISRSFERIASENARAAGADVEFRIGDAAALPVPANWFDFIVCRAAFKNFADPVGALREMHRVLRPGGMALIVDMRKDATDRSIAEQVAGMNLGAVSRVMTRTVLRSLRNRAYSREDFNRMLAATPFGRGEIEEEPLGFEIRMTK